MNPVDPKPAAQYRRLLRWWPPIVALVVGAYGGYTSLATCSTSGLGGAIGAAIFFGIVVAVAGVLTLGGVIALLFPTSRRGGQVAILSAAMFVGGVYAGRLAVSAFDLGCKPPVVLEASGSANLVLAGVVNFTPAPDGEVDCRSVPDGTAVLEITALSLGELGNGTLRAHMWPQRASSDAGSVSVWIDGADLPEGSIQPFWSGPVTFEVSNDGGAGSVTFADLTLAIGALGGTPDEVWPRTLTGRITWTCNDWLDPDST